MSDLTDPNQITAAPNAPAPVAPTPPAPVVTNAGSTVSIAAPDHAAASDQLNIIERVLHKFGAEFNVESQAALGEIKKLLKF